MLYDRPTVATSEYFKGKYVKVDGVPTILGSEAANAIEFYLIQNGYQDLVNRNYELTRAEVPQMYALQEGNSLHSILFDFAKQMKKSVEVKATDIYACFCNESTSTRITQVAFYKLLPQALKQLIPEAVPVKRIRGQEARGYKNITLGDIS